MPSYTWVSVFRQAQDENDLSKLHDRVIEGEGPKLLISRVTGH